MSTCPQGRMRLWRRYDEASRGLLRRGDIVRAEARMLRWTMGTIIAAAAVFIGIARFAG